MTTATGAARDREVNSISEPDAHSHMVLAFVGLAFSWDIRRLSDNEYLGGMGTGLEIG